VSCGAASELDEQLKTQDGLKPHEQREQVEQPKSTAFGVRRGEPVQGTEEHEERSQIDEKVHVLLGSAKLRSRHRVGIDAPGGREGVCGVRPGRGGEPERREGFAAGI